MARDRCTEKPFAGCASTHLGEDNVGQRGGLCEQLSLDGRVSDHEVLEHTTVRRVRHDGNNVAASLRSLRGGTRMESERRLKVMKSPVQPYDS